MRGKTYIYRQHTKNKKKNGHKITVRYLERKQSIGRTLEASR